ncbi:MAG: glycosyltransferase family 2 protein [Planctomyces sp.]|nr:glycosyltransferase family 2 protein [Planctomyces sp.]
MTRNASISVIVPVYNEQGNLRPLHAALVPELEGAFCDFELLFVDDGSSDQSAEVARELHEDDPRVKLISLSRNFGKQTALFAGLEHVRGDAAIVMDADLQHPPAVLPRLIAAWREGQDVVFAVRESITGTSRMSAWASRAFARVFRSLVHLPRTPHPSDFVLLDRCVIDQLKAVRERNRFFRYLVAWTGFRQTAIGYVAPERHSGRTKFRLWNLGSIAVDAITAFTCKPLRICTATGFLVALTCIPYTLWAIYGRLFTESYVPGWSALIVAILFLGSVQLIGLGILGEYIGRIYDEVKNRPMYIVRESLGVRTDAARAPSARRPGGARAIEDASDETVELAVQE